MKYTIQDFLSSKIALEVSEKDRPEFNRLMDEAGMKWACGHEASKHDWFPCLAENKVLRWSRGTLPVVSFSDLLLYAPADFFAGRIGVRCETRAEYDALMRECEGKGLAWNHGDAPTRWTPSMIDDWKRDAACIRIVEGRLLYYAWDIVLVPFSTLFPVPAPKQPEPAPSRKIVITADGPVTTATLYEGDKAIKTGTAKCGPRDVFDFDTGATIAYNRVRFGQQFKRTTFADFMDLSKKIKMLGAEIEGKVGKL